MSGTPSLGQFAKISSIVTLALPKALAAHDPKAIITACGNNGEQLEQILKKAFDELLNPKPVQPKDFSVFLECEVGGKSQDELLKELEAGGFYTSDYVKDIMSREAWKPGEKERVKFACTTVRELGFTKNATTAQIWARIKELGHVLCEPQDGPAIRLSLKDQKKGDYFWCAMEQITDSDGCPDVFSVHRGDGGESWLSTAWVGPDDGWSLVDELVFRLRK